RTEGFRHEVIAASRPRLLLFAAERQGTGSPTLRCDWLRGHAQSDLELPGIPWEFWIAVLVAPNPSRARFQVAGACSMVSVNDVRRIIGKKDLLGRTRILRRNPARSHSGNCCADGRALWVCNACFF